MPKSRALAIIRHRVDTHTHARLPCPASPWVSVVTEPWFLARTSIMHQFPARVSSTLPYGKSARCLHYPQLASVAYKPTRALASPSSETSFLRRNLLFSRIRLYNWVLLQSLYDGSSSIAAYDDVVELLTMHRQGCALVRDRDDCVSSVSRLTLVIFLEPKSDFAALIAGTVPGFA